eukprot:COSAG02_NODE_74033_length_163_cov_334.656250_1_plen_53_part_11
MSAASEAHGVVVDNLIGDHDVEKARLLEAHSAETAALRTELLDQASEHQAYTD